MFVNKLRQSSTVIISALISLTLVIGALVFFTRTPKAIDAMEIRVYFADDKYLRLVPESRVIKFPERRGFETETTPIYEIILNELLKGPTHRELRRTLPKGARLLSASAENGIVYANFSKELRSEQGDGANREALAVDSVVQSVTQVPSFEKVQFLVEGEIVDMLAGHVRIDEPVSKPTQLP